MSVTPDSAARICWVLERDGGRLLRGETESLVEGVGVKRLGSAQSGRHRLYGGPDDVVLGLLGGEGRARRLGVETHPLGGRVCCAESVPS